MRAVVVVCVTCSARVSAEPRIDARIGSGLLSESLTGVESMKVDLTYVVVDAEAMFTLWDKDKNVGFRIGAGASLAVAVASAPEGYTTGRPQPWHADVALAIRSPESGLSASIGPTALYLDRNEAEILVGVGGELRKEWTPADAYPVSVTIDVRDSLFSFATYERAELEITAGIALGFH